MFPSLFSVASNGAVSWLPGLLLLVKATVLLLAALAATQVMPRLSAGARHLVWLATVAALLLLPAFVAWSPFRLSILPLPASLALEGARMAAVDDAGTVSRGTRDVRLSLSSVREGNKQNAAPVAGATSSVAEVTSQHPSATSSSVDAPPSLSRWSAFAAPWGPVKTLLAIWAVVAVGLMGWLLSGQLAVHRIVRRATHLDSADWQDPLYEIADRLSLDVAPRLLSSRDITMPFACGVLQPTIVLPAEAGSWSAERRSAVLLHELGHVRRRDLVGHTLGRFACALYWFHPLVWTAARRLRAESERACDDLALTCGARASDYAEHLLEIITRVRNHTTPSVALAMAHRNEFEGRMLAILDPELRRKAPSRAQSVTLLGTLAALALVVAAASPTAPEAQAALVSAPSPRDGAPRADSNRPGISSTFTARDSQQATVVDRAMRTDSHVDTRTSRPTPNASQAKDAPPQADHVSKADEQDLAALQAILRLNGNALVQKRDSDDRPMLLARVLRTDSSASLRRVAAWGLGQFENSDVAIDALVTAVRRDADVGVREMAAWALGNADESSKSVAALIDVVKQEKDPKVRSTAVWGIGNSGGSRDNGQASTDALAAVLNDSSVKVREMAAWGIGNIEPRKAPKELLAALSDKEASVRRSAAWAIAQIEDVDAIAAVESALGKETDKDAEMALVRALGAMGEKSVDAIKRLLDSKDPDIRAMAIRSLAGQGPGAWPNPRPRPRPRPNP